MIAEHLRIYCGKDGELVGDQRGRLASMTRPWTSNKEAVLVRQMARLPGADLRPFFESQGLAEAYLGVARWKGKRARIYAALREAERRGVVEETRDAARRELLGADGASGRNRLAPEPSSTQLKGFLSHASADEEVAVPLQRTLVLGGVPQDRIFFSLRRGSGIPAGKLVDEQIQAALRETGVFVALISESYLGSPYCLAELHGVLGTATPVFPIVLPPLTREAATRHIGNIQMSTWNDERDIEDTMSELQDMIRDHLHIEIRSTHWDSAVRSLKAELMAIRKKPQA